MFEDRYEAGKRLAEALEKYRDDNPIILALPRGGVPVAYEVAKKLQAQLCVVVVRKLGLPTHPEVGFGAIAPEGVVVYNEQLIDTIELSEREIEFVKTKEEVELSKRLKLFNRHCGLDCINNRTVIIVDDGMATGVTNQVAIRYIKTFNPSKVILAVPVGPRDTIQELGLEADEIICLYIPEHFTAVGQWYRNFEQVSLDEVGSLLDRANILREEVKI